MNLSECLLYRDIAELSSMATFYDCICNKNSKLELVQSLHFSMLNKDNYRRLLPSLDRELLYFATYILFQPHRVFTINELIGKGNEMAAQLVSGEVSPRKWVAQLLKKGWLFPNSTTYQVQLEIPSDLRSFLRKQLSIYWLENMSIEVNPQGMAQGYVDEGDALIVDLLYFLKQVQTTPQPLSIEGYIYKKNQQLLFQHFQVAEAILPEQRYRFGYGRRFPAYPNRFSLLYDYCFTNHYIIENDTFLSLTGLGEEFIQSCHPTQYADLRRDLLDFWIKTYKHPLPNLPFIYTLLIELTSSRIVNTADLFTFISLWLKEYYFDDLQTIYQVRILKMMLHLGIIQVSLDQKYITLKNSL